MQSFKILNNVLSNNNNDDDDDDEEEVEWQNDEEGSVLTVKLS